MAVSGIRGRNRLQAGEEEEKKKLMGKSKWQNSNLREKNPQSVMKFRERNPARPTAIMLKIVNL